MPLLVLARGSAIFRFEATGEIRLRRESYGFRRVMNRASYHQIFERFGQAEGSDVFRWRATGQGFEFSLQLTLADIHCRGHLPKIEAKVVIILIDYLFESLDEQIRTADRYVMVLRIHRRELSIPAPLWCYQLPDKVCQIIANSLGANPVETQMALH